MGVTGKEAMSLGFAEGDRWNRDRRDREKAAQRGSAARHVHQTDNPTEKPQIYRLAIFCAMYRISLRSSSSALLNRRRSLLRKRASLPELPQAMSSDDLRLGRFGN